MNKRLVLTKPPVAGDIAQLPELFELEEQPIPELAEGFVLVRTIYISVDPYMHQYSLADPSQIGNVMKCRGVGVVLKSTVPQFKQNDHVYGTLCWQTHACVPATALTTYMADGSVRKSGGADNLRHIDTAMAAFPRYLGVLGTPGLTAFAGIKTILKPKAGETVFVSSAAGAVGCVVVQLARIAGCRVVGSAGSEEKVSFLLDAVNGCGCDAAFNYKVVSSLDKALATHCPNGIDCYFDNVGGAMLDSVLLHANDHCRIAVCGIISTLSGRGKSYRMEHMSHILTKQCKIEGFQAREHWGLMLEYTRKMQSWLRSGEVRYNETIVQGLENAPIALQQMLRGSNIGKQLVKVAEEPIEGTSGAADE